jgi:hypothetical protein
MIPLDNGRGAETTWFLDLGTRTWRTLTDDSGLGIGFRYAHSCARVAAGRAILFGGLKAAVFGSSAPIPVLPPTVFQLDMGTQVWRALGLAAGSPQPPQLAYHTMTMVDSDRAVVVGGVRADTFVFSTDVWLFSLAARTWSRFPGSAPVMAGHAATWVSSLGGSVLSGGCTQGDFNEIEQTVVVNMLIPCPGNVSDTSSLLSVAAAGNLTFTLQPLPPMPVTMVGHSTAWSDECGSLLAWGGVGTMMLPTTDMFAMNGTTAAWSRVPGIQGMPSDVRWSFASALIDVPNPTPPPSFSPPLPKTKKIKTQKNRHQKWRKIMHVSCLIPSSSFFLFFSFIFPHSFIHLFLGMFAGQDSFYVLLGQSTFSSYSGSDVTRFECRLSAWFPVQIIDVPPVRANPTVVSLTNNTALLFGGASYGFFCLADTWLLSWSPGVASGTEFADSFTWTPILYSAGDARPAARQGASFIVFNQIAYLFFGTSIAPQVYENRTEQKGEIKIAKQRLDGTKEGIRKRKELEQKTKRKGTRKVKNNNNEYW